MKEYSMAIAKKIMDYLDKEEWKYMFYEEDGVIAFGAAIGGFLKRLDYTIHVDEDSYLVFATVPFAADERNPELMELICRINCNLRFGVLQIDPDDGEIRCKMSIVCGEEGLPTDKMMEVSVFTPGKIFTMFGDTIVKVAIGAVKAKEALGDGVPDPKELGRKIAEDLISRKAREEAQKAKEAEAAAVKADDGIRVSLFDEEGGGEE